MTPQQALKVECPRCGAVVDAPCLGRRGPRASLHMERLGSKRQRVASGPRSRATRCQAIGWVYFIRSGETGLVKIGWTAGDAEKRLKDLQTGNGESLRLLMQTPGTQRDEKALHRRYAEYHVRGEWFRLTVFA